MSLIATLATLFGTISGLANLPQAYRIFKRKSAKDISILTYLVIFTGAIVWILYGFEIGDSPIIITNVLGTITISFVMMGWFLYGRD